MTKEGAEIVKGAMRAISDCCQCIDYSHETRPDNWFREVV